MKEIFLNADDEKVEIVIPCIIFFELLYLIEKKKIDMGFQPFIGSIRMAKHYRVEPLCLPIIEKSRTISKEKITDPWDRLIVATSLHLKLPLLSKDEKIRQLGLDVIW